MAFEISDRLKKLPPYLFVAIDEAKAQAIAAGVDVIDLGVGDPDLPTPEHIVQRLITAAQNPAKHHYPSSQGLAAFREAASQWLSLIHS